MKVLFVRPYQEIHMNMPPLGPLYLASCMRQIGDHEAKIIDGRLLRLKPEGILDQAREFDPDVIGITSLTMEGPAAHQIAALCKQQWPDRPVLIGGPYTSSDPDRAASDSNIDFTFYGESEGSFTSWVQAQTDGADITQIPGIAYRRNGEVVKTPHGGFIEDLDEIPFPAWDLIDFDLYFKKRFLVVHTMNPNPKRQRTLPMVTSRGCPYRCIYCHNIFGKKLRHRSVDNVIDELVLLKTRYNIGEIEIVDDIFNLDIKRAKAIFRAIIEKNLDMYFSYPNGLRSDSFDEELLDLMKQGGSYRLVFAIESGSQRMQKLMQKNLNLDKARLNIEMAAKKGFFMGGAFMLGFPDETEQEMWETINFACNSKLHTAQMFIMTPFPGTEVWERALKAGMPVDARFEDYYRVSVNLSHVPSERLEKLRSKAIAKFYLNPIRMGRFFTRVPHLFGRLFENGLVLFLTVIGKWRN